MGIFKRIAQNQELRTRLLFTLGLLAVYRIGIFVPTPGVDRNVMSEALSGGSGLLGLLNLFSGGALEQLSVFALGIMPYISASIIVQMLGMVMPAVERLRKEGEQGRRKLNAYTRYGTIALCLVQGVWMARTLIGMNDSSPGLVTNPGMLFTVTTVLALTTGTAFLMWLGEQITERGVGNGISLLITAGIVVGLPTGAMAMWHKVRAGDVQLVPTLLLIGVMLAIVATIVYFEKAQRRIPVQYANRAVGQTAFAGESSYLPLKINVTGVIPPIFASAMLMFPATVVSYFPEAGWAQAVQEALIPTDWRYNVIYVLLIIFFCFFYTALMFNPREIADNLKKGGAYLPGIRPGEQTSKYIDSVVTKLTVVGSLYITAVCLMPQFLNVYFNVPFYLGGTSLLIAVVVTMDFMAQVQSHLMSQQYESLMKKANLKGYGGGIR